jgi:ubiquinone/menaquinone biosynthesis C-methylase UbiE
MGANLRKWIPRFVSNILWGNRKRFGFKINKDDPCWIEWQETYEKFYSTNQRKSIGIKVNDAGYQVMSTIDLTGKKVLEIGAGDIRHLQYLQGKPDKYFLADISPKMMDFAKQKLKEKEISYDSILIDRNQPIPLKDETIDVIVSFFSLEHLYPLQDYLKDMYRILKPGGILIGAIPAEGGLAWGLGRMFTSRRWIKKNTNIDPDKLICWERPNFADQIISQLDTHFYRQKVIFWPFRLLPLYDINLIIKYIYKK